MQQNNFNNDFLSYEGRISRKNYIINLLILISLYISLSFVKFEVFYEYFSFGFFCTIISMLIGLLKFAFIVSAISVVYRRISDFSEFGGGMKKVFFWFYGFPLLYLWLGHYLFDFMPLLIKILDSVTLFLILPVTVILTIVFAFLKSKIN